MKAKQAAVVGILVVLVLALLYFFKATTSSLSSSSRPSAQESSQSTTPQANQKTFELVVKNNKLVSGPDTLTVNEGDQVTIKITADVNGELHLHGYDKHVDFKKNTPAELNFKANVSGRFPYELEDTKTEVGALEVLPK